MYGYVVLEKIRKGKVVERISERNTLYLGSDTTNGFGYIANSLITKNSSDMDAFSYIRFIDNNSNVLSNVSGSLTNNTTGFTVVATYTASSSITVGSLELNDNNSHKIATKSVSQALNDGDSLKVTWTISFS